MLYRHVFDKISTEFRGILRVFVNFAALRWREISEALTTSSIIYTNWRLKIYIWRLHFSSWSPKGELRIFLISSPGMQPQNLKVSSDCCLQRILLPQFQGSSLFQYFKDKFTKHLYPQIAGLIKEGRAKKIGFNILKV